MPTSEQKSRFFPSAYYSILNTLQPAFLGCLRTVCFYDHSMTSRAYSWTEITLSESNRLRSLAILMIVIHNFLHLILDTPGENEFGYSAEKFQSFLDGLWNTPQDSIRIISSYLGHYGVQVFFFLSGYGAAIKYRNTHSAPSWWTYVRRRLSALYPAILIAAAGFIIYNGYDFAIKIQGANLVRQILGVSNFIPDNIYHPIGPWWFIGVIVQFYLIVPLIFRQKKIKPERLFLYLIAGALLLESFGGALIWHLFSLNINHTILGHLDVCALGMLAAHYKQKSIPSWILLVAAALFILGNYNVIVWTTASLTATILLIPLLRFIAGWLSKSKLADRAMLFLGGISIYMFLCNGYLRWPLIDQVRENPTWNNNITTCLIFVGLVILWATGSRLLEILLRKIISSK